MNLRWGIDGPTVEFDKTPGWDAWFALIGNLEIQIAVHSVGYEATLTYCSVIAPLYAEGGCQQTALDRLHARLREVAAEITAAL